MQKCRAIEPSDYRNAPRHVLVRHVPVLWKVDTLRKNPDLPAYITWGGRRVPDFATKKNGYLPLVVNALYIDLISAFRFHCPVPTRNNLPSCLVQVKDQRIGKRIIISTFKTLCMKSFLISAKSQGNFFTAFVRFLFYISHSMRSV